MDASKLVPDVWYVVISGTHDGALKECDRVMLAEDGALVCPEAGGFLSAEDAGEVIKDIEVVVDLAYLDEERKRLSDLEGRYLEAERRLAGAGAGAGKEG